MNRKYKFRIISINIISMLFLLFFIQLCWQQLTINTAYYAVDFKTFYTSLRHHENIYENHFFTQVLGIQQTENKSKLILSAPMSSVNLNTPGMSLIVKALVNISDRLHVITLTWIIASIIAAAVSLLFLLTLLPLSHTKIVYFLPGLTLFLFSWPCVYDLLATGQLALLLLPFLSVAFVLLDLKKWRSMAIILGLVASLKIFFLILILFFAVKREWKLAGLFIASFLFFLFLPFLYFDVVVYKNFFKLSQNEWLFIQRSLAVQNGSLLGVVTRLAVFFKIHTNFIRIKIVTGILVVYTIARFLMYDYKNLRQLKYFSDHFLFCFLIIVALLCSPLAWAYYFVFLIIPIILFIKINEYYRLPISFYIFLMMAFVLPYFSWHDVHGRIFQYIQPFFCTISLLCWLGCLCCAVTAVHNPKKPAKKNNIIFFSIVVFFALLSILNVYISSDIFASFFSKTVQINKVVPGMWIEKE